VRSGSLCAALVLCLALGGCSDEPTAGPTAADYEAERERVAAQLKRRRSKATAPAPAVVTKADAKGSGFGSVADDYVYDFRGKRDPFRSWGFVNPMKRTTTGGPLANFELGQLAIVAVVWETGRPRALVTDPAGRSFIIREGSRVGKNDGRVIHIGDNLVLVKETYVDFAGEQTTKDVELRIRRSQGG